MEYDGYHRDHKGGAEFHREILSFSVCSVRYSVYLCVKVLIIKIDHL